MDMVLPGPDETQPIILTDRGQAFVDLWQGWGPRADLEDVRESPDFRHVIAELAPNAIGYERVLMDLKAGTIRSLGETKFLTRHKDTLVPTEEVRIPARDGTSLPAFLMRPKGVTGPVPLIVWVHGGPARHSSWGYHHERQLLVNRGYAVLSVNFRGSTGYGKAFQELGYGEYGRAMQHDLEDAALWAVEAGIADAEALAVMGGSYGGYAAAMAVLQRPDLFKAAVVRHAMLDVEYQSQYPPADWALYLGGWHAYFGDPRDPEMAELQRKRSPVHLAADLQRPVSVIAGKNDQVTGVEQTEAFIKAAQNAGADVQTLYFDDEGHGVGRWQNRIKQARAMEEFLQDHLGGQSGGWDWIEVAAEHL